MPGTAGRIARSAPHRALVLVTGVLMLLALLLAHPALAQSFPELTGRVVDGANIIPDDEEARLTQKLATLDAQTHRQLVVVTLPDLQGYDIADYGYQLGRKWGIGTKDKNDGAILIVAPKERRVRVEVGYGLEGVLTDGLSSLIIQREIVPRFKAGDMAGGIEAGTNALVQQLSLPEDQARQNVAAAQAQAQDRQASSGNVVGSTLFWLFLFFLFFGLPMLRRMRGGRAYHGSGLGPIILWSVLDGMSRGGGGGGGGGSDWGGGGGFSGGGGSFGGGGSSGSW